MSLFYKISLLFYIILTLIPDSAHAGLKESKRESFFQEASDNEWIVYYDSISGLYFNFPDTPVVQFSKTGNFESYTITFTEPGSNYIVEVDSIEIRTPQDQDSILLSSLEKLLDSRAKILEYSIFEKPIPHITAKVQGRYAVHFDYQAFIYKSLLFRQIAINLGNYQEKEKVKRFFKSF